MSLPDLDELFRRADARPSPSTLCVAGGADSTVIEALRRAADRGWVRPVLVGPESETRRLAADLDLDLDGFRLIDAADPGPAAVAECRSGRSDLLQKGRIATPDLMRAILDPERGLRSDRTICQVVLMEVLRDRRRFLMADTGIMVRPKPPTRARIAGHGVAMARALGLEAPRVALMAASESPRAEMPDTIESAELARVLAVEYPSCQFQGPLSFDLAYAADAGERKRVDGPVVGSADVMVFPDLNSANLAVKAIMYTADCRYAGVLKGATHPVVFMSRADSVETRLRSIALALSLLPGPAA